MKDLGLYIHIPFCDGKCHYCDFFSQCGDEIEFDTYTDRLIKKLKYCKNKYKSYNIKTVYFGGGTPTAIGTERLIKILNSVFENFSVKKDAEITVEMNPVFNNEIDYKKLRNSGFNRLSIGLQSANDNELKILGRRHKSMDVKNTVTNARNAGFDNISLDLMLCIPNQTFKSLVSSIDFCFGLDVEHISVYILKIEENTKFYSIKDKLNLFNDEQQAQMYELAVNTLEKYGYQQYEISNFCKSGYESKHNLIYWRDEEYLGIGPSAHSFINGKRFYYGRSFEDFYSDKIIFESDGGDIEEYIMLALRLKEGLIFEKFQNRFKKPVSDKLIDRAKKLEEKGYLNITDNNISLTTKGFLLSNSVISYLIY